jgi:hypothetical protein
MTLPVVRVAMPVVPIMRAVLVLIFVMAAMFVMMLMVGLILPGTGICLALLVHLGRGPRDQAFELAAVKPDAPALLTHVYRYSVLLPFLESVLVASWAQHSDSFA